MIEIFLVTIAAFSTLAFLTFICVQKKYDVQAPMQNSKSFQKEMMKHEPKIKPRKSKTSNNQQQNDQGQKLSDIEKGLLNSNSRTSYSPQRSENDHDNDLSRTSSNQIETPTTQESTVFANPRIAVKVSHRELALPPPPHLRHVDSTPDHSLQRSESDIDKRNSAQVKAITNFKNSEHPLENSTSKRSLIPLPSTPVDVITKCFPPPPVLKRGKSQSELDVGSGNVDLGYENLTMERNNLNKRYSTDVIEENCVPGNYPRPKHYAQLKKNSYHGSFSDMTPPNSAYLQKSFDFSPKNTRIRGRTIPSGPESSPFHPPIPNSSGISPNNTRSFKVEPSRLNQSSLEIKLSDIASQMNKLSLDDSNSLSPVDESSQRHRNDSTDTSEIHENSIYNLNEMSSPEIQTESSGSGRSKKRYTNESSSSDDYSIHENVLYESIEGNLNEPSLREDKKKKQKVMLGDSTYSQHNSSVFYSELARTDPTYYDSITMMRIESNTSTKDSDYGNFLKDTISNSLAGCEHYDTLTHFPSVSSSKPNPNRSSPEEEVFALKDGSPISTLPHDTQPDTQPENTYESLSDDEDEMFRPSLRGQLRKSVHDYEKINEDDLQHVKQAREIGPF